jgi:ABC-type multidrug transport system ATPase subunit
VNNGEKTILKNCSGKVYPQQICAILGPSGKTPL